MVIPTSLVIKHFYIFRIATGLEDKLHFIKMLKQYPLHGPTHRGTKGTYFPWSLKKNYVTYIATKVLADAFGACNIPSNLVENAAKTQKLFCALVAPKNDRLFGRWWFCPSAKIYAGAHDPLPTRL